MTLADVLTNPLVVGLTGFILGAVALAVGMAVTSTRGWHDRHHQTRSELMCDRCRARRRTNPAAAPRMRVLGERRWRR